MITNIYVCKNTLCIKVVNFPEEVGADSWIPLSYAGGRSHAWQWCDATGLSVYL